jgi:dTDP-4-amino-4,6-dideoxygalactose transaminase
MCPRGGHESRKDLKKPYWSRVLPSARPPFPFIRRRHGDDKRPGLAEPVRLLRNQGAKPKYYHKVVGGNFRLDALQAAVLRVKLKYLDGWTAGRQRNAAAHRRLLEEVGLAVSTGSLTCSQGGCRGEACDLHCAAGVVPPTEAAQRRHIYNQFVIRSGRRDALMAHLRERGLAWRSTTPCRCTCRSASPGSAIERGTSL